jgi:hypothetical protein
MFLPHIRMFYFLGLLVYQNIQVNNYNNNNNNNNNNNTDRNANMNMNTNTRKLFKMVQDFVENSVYDFMSQSDDMSRRRMDDRPNQFEDSVSPMIYGKEQRENIKEVEIGWKQSDAVMRLPFDDIVSQSGSVVSYFGNIARQSDGTATLSEKNGSSQEQTLSREQVKFTHTSLHVSRAQIGKLLRSPGIDSKESTPPAYVAWWAGTSDKVVVTAHLDWN